MRVTNDVQIKVRKFLEISRCSFTSPAFWASFLIHKKTEFIRELMCNVFLFVFRIFTIV